MELEPVLADQVRAGSRCRRKLRELPEALSGDWAAEMKYDGCRLSAAVRGRSPTFRSTFSLPTVPI
jgi:hypothetical protein